MKKQFLVLAVLLAVLVQSCIVKSLHPFFSEIDVVFKNELLNTWTDQDGNKWKISPVKEKPNAYQMTFNKDGKQAVFMVHLFNLEGNLFLDFLPLASDSEEIDLFNMHLLPSHSVAKVEKMTDQTVVITWFNEEWLRDLFDHNKIKIAHEAIADEKPKDKDDRYYILTASTEELRKFLIKYGNDEKAFTGDNTVRLTLKRSA